MKTLPQPLTDDDRVSVTLSPSLAHEVANTLRIQLACELDRSVDAPLPTKEHAARLRAILDVCVDQLETLAWGEASRDVRMLAPRRLLETIAQDLLDGGNERVANPLGWNSPDAQSVRRQAQLMIRAAAAINRALDSEQYQMAS